VQETFTPQFLTEILGSSFSIVYSILLMREKIAAWFFGFASSILSMIVFFETKLYAQAIISIYYAAVAVYGWIYWIRAKKRDEHIRVWNIQAHVLAILIFSILSWSTAYFFKTYTDSSNPYLDSFLTLFGLLASIKEARKILTSWVYWFVINALSVWLYFNGKLHFYAVIMVIYTILCIPGFLSWYKIFKEKTISA
jgi:nicotinamide mononucleotide transporter